MGFLSTIMPLYSVSGFGVGLLVGMTGVGGGSLMTPLLVLVFGIHPATAVGTDLLYAAATKSVGTAVHGLHGTIQWRIVGLLAAGSIPATAFTLLAMMRLGSPSDSVAFLITLVLGIALLLTAASLTFRDRIVRFAMRHVDEPSEQATARLTILTGAALGVLVSISSVGAGAIGVTVLILLYRRLPIAQVVGTDIAHAVPLTLLAGMGHWFIGSVDWHLLLSLLVGSIPGVVAGSFLSAHVPERVLRPILAATLAVVGSRLVL